MGVEMFVCCCDVVLKPNLFGLWGFAVTLCFGLIACVRHGFCGLWVVDIAVCDVLGIWCGVA